MSETLIIGASNTRLVEGWYEISKIEHDGDVHVAVNRLRVMGDIAVRGTIYAHGDIYARGNINARDIDARGGICAVGTINTSGDIYADGTIYAGGGINARGGICARDIDARGIDAGGRIAIVEGGDA